MRRIVSSILVALLFLSLFVFAFNVQPAKAQPVGVGVDLVAVSIQNTTYVPPITVDNLTGNMLDYQTLAPVYINYTIQVKYNNVTGPVIYANVALKRTDIWNISPDYYPIVLTVALIPGEVYTTSVTWHENTTMMNGIWKISLYTDPISTAGGGEVYDVDPANTEVASPYMVKSIHDNKPYVVGDLGSRVYNATGGYQDEFGVFDGLVDNADVNLFLQCYKGTAPAQWMYLADLGSRVEVSPGVYANEFFVYDGLVNMVDLYLFLLCYHTCVVMTVAGQSAIVNTNAAINSSHVTSNALIFNAFSPISSEQISDPPDWANITFPNTTPPTNTTDLAVFINGYPLKPPATITNNATDYFICFNFTLSLDPTIAIQYAPAADVAVTNITSFHPAVGQGFNDNITVTVEDTSSLTENFTVTAYANNRASRITSSIAQLSTNITLSPINSTTTITFTWNTSTFAKGNYTISAYAWPAAGEIDISGCNFTGGSVPITTVGDFGGYPKNGSVVAQFGLFTGSCGPVDIPLFIHCYDRTAPKLWAYLGDLGGYKPPSVVPQFFLCTGSCGPQDISLFIRCYDGYGP